MGWILSPVRMAGMEFMRSPVRMDAAFGLRDPDRREGLRPANRGLRWGLCLRREAVLGATGSVGTGDTINCVPGV